MTTIRIKQYSFSFPAKFAAGHVLSEGEAAALEALRAENIRNQVTKQIINPATEKAEANGELLLSPATLASVAAKIVQYAEGYSFGKRATVRRFGVLESEARGIARAVVLARARSEGSVMDEGELLAAIEVEAESEVVQMEARARLADNARIASVALEDLL